MIREASTEDIKQIQRVRNSVKENTLSNPALVTDDDCREFINVRGKGWVCEIEHIIVGFSIVDLKENNVWALFVLPEFENMGIGSQLHQAMLDWYFSKTRNTLWLGTAFNTKAERFYRKRGWVEVGTNGPKELKFEMSYEIWQLSKTFSASRNK